MKVGLRTPSIKKTIKARTTGKAKRAIKKATNPLYGETGMGLIKDPKKAIYNKVYNKTTVSIMDISEPVNENTSQISSNAQSQELTSKPHKAMNTSLKTIIWLILFFPVGLYFMWSAAKWPLAVKIAISVLFAIIVLATAV